MTRGPDWIEALTAGDQVVVDRGRYGARLRLVERTTPTQIITDRGSRYWKKSGELVGGASDCWSTDNLKEATPERVAKVRAGERRVKALDSLTRMDWKTLKTETLERIIRVVNGEPDDKSG